MPPCPANLLPWEESLRNIPDAQADASLTIIEKLIKNIVSDPTNDKFKRIKLSNPKIHSCITSVDPALEALLLMGWELLDEDTLFLPDDLMMNVSDFPGRIMAAKAYFAKKGAPRAAAGTSPVHQGGTAGPSAPSASTPTTTSCGTKSSVASKSAFQFQNRSAKEAAEKNVANSLADLRRQKAAEYTNKAQEQADANSFGNYFNFGGSTSSSSPTPQSATVSNANPAYQQNMPMGGGSSSSSRASTGRYRGSNVELREMSEPLLSPDRSGGGDPTVGADPHVRPSHNFQKQVEREATEKAAAQDDLRSLQKAKYKQYKNDPALQQRALQNQNRLQGSSSSSQPSNDDGGSWWNPFSGGGGSGGSGGGPPPSGGANRPRMKTVKDLPKPVRRG
ncbi:unnamed protein product [Amoebophrya sp. A25]|nr:unnamed protein product [Amoebophrya sp. A25]|eukprot:GSA25T00004204001.1